MPKLNVAVIGLGNMGQHHTRVYSEMPEVNLTALCDIDEKRGRNLAKKYNSTFYSDYKKMFNEEKINAVSIVVPTFLHYKVACEVLDRGVNVLLEKPIAINLREAREIINKAKRKKLKLMVGHIERFNPAIQRLKEMVKNGRIGKIISINIKRVGGLPPQLKNANVVIDLGIHDVDISNYLLGEYPKEVYGFKSKNLITEQEDSAVIMLKYKKASSFIEANWVTPVKIRTLDITGTKAFARLDYINQAITLYERNYLKDDRKYASFSEFVSKFSQADEVRVAMEKAEPLRKELENFVAAVEGQSQFLVDNEEAFRTFEIALKI